MENFINDSRSPGRNSNTACQHKGTSSPPHQGDIWNMFSGKENHIVTYMCDYRRGLNLLTCNFFFNPNVFFQEHYAKCCGAITSSPLIPNLMVWGL
jgi:hypothetical protein